MNRVIGLVIVAVVGYLLGNFQTGIVVGRLVGKIDIRTRGSNSAGTTNVLRTMGWLPSILTLVGDMLKGALAAAVGYWLGGIWGARLGGLCAVIGHNWPVFFGFKGGKGIAASGGVILVLDPLIGVCLILCQVIVVAITRTMSIASMASVVVYIVMTVIIHFGDGWAIGYAVLIGVLAVFSHRSNIERLARHSENTLDFKEIDRISRRK